MALWFVCVTNLFHSPTMIDKHIRLKTGVELQQAGALEGQMVFKETCSPASSLGQVKTFLGYYKNVESN